MSSEQFDSLRNLLAREGFESITVDHASVGNEPADQTLDTDVANLRNTLTQLIDQDGKDVVLLLHSYGTFKAGLDHLLSCTYSLWVLGGLVGSCASKGFGTKQRADEGKRGGITAIIFVTAFLLQVGENLLDKLGGNWPAWMELRVSCTRPSVMDKSDICRVPKFTSVKLPRSAFPTYRKTSRRDGMPVLRTLRLVPSKVLPHMSLGLRYPAYTSSVKMIHNCCRLFKKQWPYL